MEEVGIYNAEGRFDEYPFMWSRWYETENRYCDCFSLSSDILICDEPTTALDVTIQASTDHSFDQETRKRYGQIIFITMT